MKQSGENDWRFVPGVTVSNPSSQLYSGPIRLFAARRIASANGALTTIAPKIQSDAEYAEVVRDSQRKWRDAHPDYQQNYRQSHPRSAEQNRERQRVRDRQRRLLYLEKNNLAFNLKR